MLNFTIFIKCFSIFPKTLFINITMLKGTTIYNFGGKGDYNL